MKPHCVIALCIAAALSIAAAVTAQPATQPAAQQYQVPVFAPGFDDLMTMLVQPRHIKLHYAGAAKNWELAAAEARNLRTTLHHIAQALPHYAGNKVDAANATFIGPPMDAIDAAIAAADPKKFAAAYKGLTDACNDCHTYMERPYVVIKVPAGPQPYPDQVFAPGP